MLKPDQSHKIAQQLAVLKDTSELMIDLAYSSLFFNSRELANEVQMLEESVDKLYTEFELSVLSSGFKAEESQKFLGLMRLGEVTERIADAAAKISEVVLRGLDTHPVLKLVIKDAEETVTRVIVSGKSSLINKTFQEAQIPEETGMWVLVLRRGDKWLRPKPDTVIKTGDVIIASGYVEGEDDLNKLVSGQV